ncbi:SAM-dependent methyltransferase [Tibeticola sp.]|uniref:class I SAM-dependent methyltransferase n=1 Tax=Tibeticola sp. TaxID=2005368 RepID=UPI002586FBC8|nr:SAM-dependent methyltransferase [Tibeticola sp.]MCI4440496.1 SAM-dependent methyltransferase [Tibeticola sp.]
MDKRASVPTPPPPRGTEGHAALDRLLAQTIAAAGGWIGFDRFMALALYAPGLGYYSGGAPKFGHFPQGQNGAGSDFVTAPELSPLFAQTLAVPLAEALARTGTDALWEFGAGSGALAAELLAALDAMGVAVRRYTIVEVSGNLRARQRERLAAWGQRVQWADTLPDAIEGVVIGNELLDAMPVKLLARRGGVWFERGVARAADGAYAWVERPTELRPPIEPEGRHDYLTEIHPQAEAFVATLAERLRASPRGGAAFFIDYGFPEAEYYHPERSAGTLMCHRAHRADADPLSDVGEKDITAHVNFTGIALAAQDAGLSTLGYTAQGRFLLNCGIAQRMEAADLATRTQAHRLIAEHEMGELFKVLALCTGEGWPSCGFATGDRTHRL